MKRTGARDSTGKVSDMGLSRLAPMMVVIILAGCTAGAGPPPTPTAHSTSPEPRALAPAPPLPEANFENRLQVKDQAYVFEYDGTDERLRYRYAPATGSLHDLTVEAEGLPPFWTSAFGGPTFVLPDGEMPIWEADALSRSYTVRQSPSALEVAWRFENSAGHAFAYVYRFAIHGKTLRVEVASETDRLSAFSLDRSEATPGARIVRLPYLATHDVLFYGGRFITAYFDWTRSDASTYDKVSQPYSERSFHFGQVAHYRPDSRGARRRMREVIYLTVSKRLTEVLPQIAHPPSPYRSALTGKVLVDLWTEGPFADSQALIEALERRGVTDLIVVRHPWQRCGYDDCYPSVLPAREVWGGDAGLRALSEAARRAGYRFAVHENYSDIYPNSDLWAPEWAALDEAGQPRLGWLNRTTGVQAYQLSPSRAVGVAAQFALEIHRRYGTTAAFVDVHTAVPPWYRTDYNADAPGGGRFSPVWRAYVDLLAYMRDAHAGPVIGEGGAHVLYAGFVDGVAAHDQESPTPGHATPPLVDFALSRIHPLMVSFGVGYFPFYFGSVEQPKWSGYTPDDHNRYMATEIAFCHAGYVDSPEGFPSVEAWLEWVAREARLVAPVHRRCAASRPVQIRYRVNGALVGVEEAIAADQLWQVHVAYENGLRVYVNRHPTAPWPVTLEFSPTWAAGSVLMDGRRHDFVGASADTEFVLPPDGWLAVCPHPCAPLPKGEGMGVRVQ